MFANAKSEGSDENMSEEYTTDRILWCRMRI